MSTRGSIVLVLVTLIAVLRLGPGPLRPQDGPRLAEDPLAMPRARVAGVCQHDVPPGWATPLHQHAGGPGAAPPTGPAR